MLYSLRAAPNSAYASYSPMRAISLHGSELTAGVIQGRVLCHDAGPGLRKGARLKVEDLPRLQALDEVHIADLEPGDLHEDAAARRLGAALAGHGTRAEEPVQSQVRLVAAHRGLLRVSREAVERLNSIDTVGVFTLVDGQAVVAGEEVAGCKVTPVAVPERVIEDAERIASQLDPVVEVVPFRPLRTFVVVTERLKPRARDVFQQAVSRKLEWYGARLMEVRSVPRTREAIRAAYVAAREAGAELVLFAGASSIDPLDAAYRELEAAGGRLLRTGAPAHPGSMLWLGRLGDAAVLGVASCAGFGKMTALDLVLPFVFAYGRASSADLAGLGHGGLVEKGAGRRFPAYDEGPP